MTRYKELSRIIERLPPRYLIGELEPQDKGTYYEMICPQCRLRRAFGKKPLRMIVCNRRNNCAYAESVVSYIMRREGIDNIDDLIAFLEGKPPPPSSVSVRHVTSKRRTVAVRKLWEELRQGDATVARQYLVKERKIDPIISDTVEYRQDKEGNHIVFPFRDGKGDVQSLEYKPIAPGARVYTRGPRKGSAYFPVYPPPPSPFLFVCESPIDAITLFQAAELSLGDKPFPIATGGTCNRELPWLKDEIIYIVFDNDRAGMEGARKLWKSLNRDNVRVAILKLDTKYKDVNDILKEEGVEALVRVLDSAIRSIL